MEGVRDGKEFLFSEVFAKFFISISIFVKKETADMYIFLRGAFFFFFHIKF